MNMIKDEFMQKEFSKEITHQEAISFLAACPYKKSGSLMMLHYLSLVGSGLTPYEMLDKVMDLLFQAIEEVESEKGNEN